MLWLQNENISNPFISVRFFITPTVTTLWILSVKPTEKLFDSIFVLFQSFFLFYWHTIFHIILVIFLFKLSQPINDRKITVKCEWPREKQIERKKQMQSKRFYTWHFKIMFLEMYELFEPLKYRVFVYL